MNAGLGVDPLAPDSLLLPFTVPPLCRVGVDGGTLDDSGLGSGFVLEV